MVNVDDDVRENIIHYDEEGVGQYVGMTVWPSVLVCWNKSMVKCVSVWE